MKSFKMWEKPYLQMNSREYFEATQGRWGIDIELFQDYNKTMANIKKGGSL